MVFLHLGGTVGHLYLWVLHPEIWRAFYVLWTARLGATDLSILGFWYPPGSWNQSLADGCNLLFEEIDKIHTEHTYILKGIKKRPGFFLSGSAVNEPN